MRFPYAFGAVALALCGCGEDGPKLVAVAGRVTLEEKAVAFKSVRFIPEPGTPGAGAGANTDADGKYTLLAVRPGATKDTPGVPAGKYRVVVMEPVIPIDSAPPVALEDGTTAAIGLPSTRARPRVGIPAAYTTPESTPLTIEVPAEGGSFDLKLKTKP